MAEDLKDKTTKGLVWSFIDKFGQQIIYLVSGIVLARILLPDDYGSIGVLTVFVALSNILIDGGFIRGLLNKKKVTQDDYNTVFYFNLIISVILYIILFVCAPFIACFFDLSELKDLSRIVFLSIPFGAFSAVQNAILWREMNFKDQTKANITALTLASAIALIMAYCGWGIWALVSQGVLLSLIRSLVLWIISSWRPSMSFRANTLKELFPFGSKLLIAGIINVLFNNIYTLIIAKFFNVAQVGYYNQANKYQDIPNGIIASTFRSTIMPALAEVSDDNERAKRVLTKVIKTAAFFGFPICVCLIVVGEPLLVILISEKWLPSVILFKILSIAGLLNIFIQIFNELVISKGRSDIFLGIEMIKKSILIILIIGSVKLGVTALAISWVVYSFISLLIALYYSGKLIGYSVVDFLKNTFIPILIAFIFGIISYTVIKDMDNNWIELILPIFIIGIGYFITTFLIRTEVAIEMGELIRNKLSDIRQNKK